jgi:hypothetical protein
MRASGRYDPLFLGALEQVQVEESQTEAHAVKVTQLRKGMFVGADVRSSKGLLLLGKGQEVTEAAIVRLLSFHRTVGVAEPIPVVIRKATTATAGLVR